MERRSRRSRIFLGPIEIAGFFRGLESGFRDIGESADLHDISGDPFRYRWTRAPGSDGARGRGGPLSELLGRARRGVARVVLFIWALARYDTFVIGGTGFWSGRELPILRSLGKRVVWVFLGTDHRPPYLNGKFVGRGLTWSDLSRKTRSTAARVRRVERWAHGVVAHEASAQFHRRRFVRLLEVGLPVVIDAEVLGDRGPDEEKARPVRILHCPTDPVAKATVRIRAIVEALAQSGPSIEYRELAGRPHGEVLEAIARSDVVIDELYGDTPLGVLAAEAAWLARPALCGGYFAEGHCRPLADGATFPGGFVPPDGLHDAVRRLVEAPDERTRLGVSARAFVRSRWTAAQVAARMQAVIDGQVLESWMVDPAAVTYVDGYGLPRADRIAAVRGLVQHEGERALALAHRPDLVRNLMAV